MKTFFLGNKMYSYKKNKISYGRLVGWALVVHMLLGINNSVYAEPSKAANQQDIVTQNKEAVESEDTVAPINEGDKVSDAVQLEEQVVTGSYIPKSEGDSITPVAIIDREKIERSGAQTLNELFKKNIFTTAGVIDEQFTQGAAPASAGIDLRGLGLSRTLVLLNGRRMPVFPFGQSKVGAGNSDSFVDINLIPLGAVERVEILKDGASALYGADAVAGVVNIITRNNYDGLQLSGQYGGTVKGDGEEGRFNLLSGFSTDRTHVTLAVDYLNRSEVKAIDRDISQSANGAFDDRSQVGNPGTIIHLDGSAPPEPDPRCPAGSSDGFFCKFDFAKYNTLIPEVERTGMMLSLDHDFSDYLRAFLRSTYSHSYSQRSLAPATAPVFFIDPANPNNPFPGEPILSVYRLNELGPRVDAFKTDAYNIVTGLNANVGTWDIEFAYGMGEVDTKIKGISGYARYSKLDELVSSGILNPFGSSPGFNAAAVNYQTQRNGISRIYTADLRANGEVIDLPYGALKMAVGTEYRKEEFSDRLDSVTSSGDIPGVGGTSGEGGRDVFASYLEFDIPVWDRLNFQAAGRFDHYSDFGATFNPKGAVRWQPVDSLTLHATAGTGFKAPALHELYSGGFTGFESVYDPVLKKTYEVDFTSGGNPNLEPEKSTNWGFGFAWDVITDLNVSLDYWRIENEDAVLSSPQFYVNNEASFPGNVERDPDTGEITSVFSPFSNVAAQKMWGLDLGGSYKWELDKIGAFRLLGSATYLGSFKQQPAPGAEFRQLAGNDGNPEWRSRGSLIWNKSDYELSITANFIDGYKRPDSNSQIGSYTTFDTQAVWRPKLKLGTLTLGMDNVFDRAPPLDPNFEGWPFFNRALYNPRGRFLYVNYKYEF